MRKRLLFLIANSASLSSLVQYGSTGGLAATSLRVTPTRLTLPTGGRRGPQVADNYGRAIEATWTTSDAAVATVSAEGVVTAVDAGDATLTATFDGLTVELPVTVLAGGTLPSGTVQWQVAATPGYRVVETVRGMPGMNGTTYLLEQPLSGSGGPLLRVIDDDGTLLWSAPTPTGAADEVHVAMGDALGGVLLAVHDWASNQDAVVRVGTDGADAWRHNGVVIKGQAGDGTIYALASRPNDLQTLLNR